MFCFFEMESCYVAQASPELSILLPLELIFNSRIQWYSQHLGGRHRRVKSSLPELQDTLPQSFLSEGKNGCSDFSLEMV